MVLRHLWIIALAWVGFAITAEAQERIPPAPRDHFNDYAGVVGAAARHALNEQLVQFERTTSNQILVAIFPKMESASSVEDYTVRIAQAWGVGTGERSNGAVLFAFMQERQLYVQVGYGLEGALPDALCKQIIEDEIVPRFRAQDFEGGFRAGVEALLAAARGEYRGSGRTQADAGGGGPGEGVGIGVFVLIVLLTTLMRLLRRGVVYAPRGRRTIWMGGSPRRGGGGFGGGRSGGSFRGGGGRFGGGGAGGRW